MKIISEESGLRIDKYLNDILDYSRSTINKLIKDGLIVVNDKKIKPSYIINIGDNIDVVDNYEKEIDLVPMKMDLDIIYEDEYLIIINKPSGLVVHPGAGNFDSTLVNGLINYTNNLSTGEKFRPGIVHRIDKDTSGIIVVAKNDLVHEKLAQMFKEHSIKRTYIALVKGVIPHDKVTIDAPIGRDTSNRKKMSVVSSGKNAITHLKVIKRYHDYTLVELNLETGRTHQIRVHMKYIGYPIYNDPVYDTGNEFGQFLHSARIDFIHPITGDKMHFECPLPKYFQDFIDNLE